jgi:hypothetical protein
MALGLTLGIVLALSGGNGTHIDQSSVGSAPKPSQTSAVPAPPVSSGAASSAHPNCGIIVPADPLSARGLATPYQLTGPSGTSPATSGCTVSSSAGRAGLVQATILDPATGALAVYTPRVIAKGTRPAAGPAMPQLPPGAIVTIDFGSTSMDLTPVGATSGALTQGRCVSGPSRVSSCNGAAFFTAALPLLRTGRLHVPSAGTSANMVATGGRIGTGRDCPNVRNFEVAGPDQDVGLLVDGFLDPAFGCKPFTAPDLARHHAPATSLALDELLAARHEPRVAAQLPQAGQPGLAAYCQNMVNLQAPFLAANSGVLAVAATPAPAAGTNLLTFLAARLSASFSGLGCQRFGLTDPVTVARDQAGAATAARFDTTPQQATPAGS